MSRYEVVTSVNRNVTCYVFPCVIETSKSDSEESLKLKKRKDKTRDTSVVSRKKKKYEDDNTGEAFKVAKHNKSKRYLMGKQVSYLLEIYIRQTLGDISQR